jgi:ABC-type polysaccharide/polyol phosphate export permease
MSATATRLAGYRHALWLLTVRDLRQRTRGTLLGPVWLVIEPLFLLAVYTFVFGVLLQVRFGTGGDTLSFALYLMAGLFPYTAFQGAVQRSAGILMGNRELIQRSVFPPELLPVLPTAVSLVTEAIALSILVAAVALITGRVSATLWLLPGLILVRALLTLGFSWLVAVLAVFVRDLAQLVGMLLTLMFFATPIVYPRELIPLEWRWVQSLNPFYHLVEAYRGVIIESAWPEPGAAGLGLFVLLLAWVGLTVFLRLVGRAKDFL